MLYDIRWLVNDNIECSEHKTRKEAIKEYNRLVLSNYKYLDSLELIRHDKINDDYRVIKKES